VLRTSGPRSLYFGFVPYCLESWPYDISELLVVGAASDVRGAPGLANIKPAVFDMTVGALAGTVAVSCIDGGLYCVQQLFSDAPHQASDHLAISCFPGRLDRMHAQLV
jgi:hypothetical protein